MGNAGDVDIRNQITMPAPARKIQAAAIPITTLHPAVQHQTTIMLLPTTAPQAAAIPLEAIRQTRAATICPATAAIRQGVVATTRQAALATICQAAAASQKTAKTICPAATASRQRAAATRQVALVAIYPVTATLQQGAAAATVPQEATTRLLTVRLPAAANPQPHRIQIPLQLPLQTAIRMP